MAKLKTRTNQPVVDSEGLLEHLAQDGTTTEVGGNLEVDGTLKCAGGQEVITNIQAVIDEGNPQLNLKQGDEIVGVCDLSAVAGGGSKLYLHKLIPVSQTENPIYIVNNSSTSLDGKSIGSTDLNTFEKWKTQTNFLLFKIEIATNEIRDVQDVKFSVSGSGRGVNFYYFKLVDGVLSPQSLMINDGNYITTDVITEL